MSYSLRLVDDWCTPEKLSYALVNLARGRLPRGWRLVTDDGLAVAPTAGPPDAFVARLVRVGPDGAIAQVVRFDVPVSLAGGPRQTVRLIEEKLRTVVSNLEWGEAIQGAQ